MHRPSITPTHEAHAAASAPTVADHVEDALFSMGIEVLPMLPGGPLMPLLRAIHHKARIRPVLGRHEAGVAMMAEGQHRASGRLGAIAVTAGPGVTNAISGVSLAHSEQMPLLVISAQVADALRGRSAAQELDTVRLLQPITKASSELRSARRVGPVLRELAALALSGRPGPVHLSVPANLWLQSAAPEPSGAHWPPPGRCDVDASTVRRLLERASAPVLLAGYGVVRARASEALLALAAQLPRLRVACTPRAKGAFPESHPHSVGVFGFAGHERAERAVLEEADLVVVVGSRLGEIASAGYDTRLSRRCLVQVDLEPAEIGRNYRVDAGVIADARGFLDALVSPLPAPASVEDGALPVNARMAGVRPAPAPPTQAPADFRRAADQRRALRDHGSEPRMRPSEAVALIGRHVAANTHVYVDIGNSMAWALRYLRRDVPGHFHVNLAFGCMGHALPAAIGGVLAGAGPTLALVGDAAFAMTGMELHTAVEEGLSVVVVVMNDAGHGMVELGSRHQFGPDAVPDVRFHCPIDAAALARALGSAAETVRREDELSTALQRAFERRGPTLIDVLIDPTEAPPMDARLKVITQNFSGGAPQDGARP